MAYTLIMIQVNINYINGYFSYLLNGTEYSLLIDTEFGICNIYDEVIMLTDKPVIAIATLIHRDHIGGCKYFSNFYAYAEEVHWLNIEFPQSLEAIKGYVADRCDLPDGYDIDDYTIFQGDPAKTLVGGETINIGNRSIEVLHTHGHAPGHMCFWEPERGYLFTGNLVYKGDTLMAFFPSTDPKAYFDSQEKVAKLFPAHHTLDIQPEILIRMQDAFRELRENVKLHHGSGYKVIFQFIEQFVMSWKIEYFSFAKNKHFKIK